MSLLDHNQKKNMEMTREVHLLPAPPYMEKARAMLSKHLLEVTLNAGEHQKEFFKKCAIKIYT